MLHMNLHDLNTKTKGSFMQCDTINCKQLINIQVFYVCGSVHHASIVLIIQQDATSK